MRGEHVVGCTPCSKSRMEKQPKTLKRNPSLPHSAAKIPVQSILRLRSKRQRRNLMPCPWVQTRYPLHAHRLFHLSLSVVLLLPSQTPHRPCQAVHCQGIDQSSQVNSAHLDLQHRPWHDRSHRSSNPLLPRVCRRRRASFSNSSSNW